VTSERSPLSWKSKSIAQIERLRYHLSLVQWNEAFLLHAGDCTESFDACIQYSSALLIPVFKAKYLRQDRVDPVVFIDTHLVRIGGIAVQYADPRSSPTETINGKVITSFKNEFELIVDGLSDALGFSRTVGAERSAPFEQGGAGQLSACS
ncbi:hypothetical protein F5146DRAFT_918718, partial [Armillaria mellea]